MHIHTPPSILGEWAILWLLFDIIGRVPRFEDRGNEGLEDLCNELEQQLRTDTTNELRVTNI